MSINRILIFLCILVISVGCGSHKAEKECAIVLKKQLGGIRMKAVYDLMNRYNSDTAMISYSVETGFYSCSLYSKGMWSEYILKNQLTEVVRNANTFSSTVPYGNYFFDYRVYKLMSKWDVESIQNSCLGSTAWYDQSKICALRIHREREENHLVECFAFWDFTPDQE